jgi:hypothetical protein
MRNRILIIMTTVVVMLVLASPVLAGGGKVRGDNGQGYVYQTAGEPPNRP